MTTVDAIAPGAAAAAAAPRVSLGAVKDVSEFFTEEVQRRIRTGDNNTALGEVAVRKNQSANDPTDQDPSSGSASDAYWQAGPEVASRPIPSGGSRTDWGVPPAGLHVLPGRRDAGGQAPGVQGPPGKDPDHKPYVHLAGTTGPSHPSTPSPAAPAAPVSPAQQRDADNKVVEQTRAKAAGGTPNADMNRTAAEFEKYSQAMPYAWAALNMNGMDDADAAHAPAPHAGIARLPLDAAGVNQALGIDPASRDAIGDQDLRNDQTGFRAALYRSEANGKLMLVMRDTQPRSLEDWKNNIGNGRGQDTPQYQEARRLATKLVNADVQFDIAGYSKGGGLAQEAGLVSSNSKVYVFNSAGLNSASLDRTNNADFKSLEARTTAFSAQDDFLTFMNNTTDEPRQIENAQFLRGELKDGDAWIANKMRIDYDNPADRDHPTPGFDKRKAAFIADLDKMIADRQQHPGGPPMFPPVRAGSAETIPNSWTYLGSTYHEDSDHITQGKLVQHQMDNVATSMERVIAADRTKMNTYLGPK